MVAIASIGFYNVKYYNKICGNFSSRNIGRPLDVESHGGRGDLTGLY